MSSSTRSRPRLRALGVLLALVPAGPTTVPLPGVTVLPVADRQVSLVVDIAGGTRPLPPEAVSVDVAGGDLAARLAREHVLLVVVSTAAATRYWTDATRPTGGFLAPAGAATVPAFDQVATTLRDRYLVTFPAPAQLPARASVRVDLPQVAMATDVVIPAADAPPDRGSGGGWLTGAVWVAVLVADELLLDGGAVRRRQR